MSRSPVRAPASAALASLVLAIGCNPQNQVPGFDGVLVPKTPPDDPSLGCGAVLPADTEGSQRTACAFGSGALAEQTLGVSPGVSAALPIRHVIIMMKENRSFDHLFGKLHEQGQPATEAVPASFTNLDLAGHAVGPFHAATTCLHDDAGHQSAAIQECVGGGTMAG